MAHRILIVEDDPAQLRYLETVVRGLGYDTVTANDGQKAVELLQKTGGEGLDLALLDLVLPKIDGFGVLAEVARLERPIPTIVLTVSGGVGTVVKVMRSGAADFVVKPVSPERLQISIENTLKISTLSGEVGRLSRQMGGELSFADLIAAAPAMRNVVDLAARAARSNIAVLLEGESGVGKEMIARAIQGASDRSGRPFVAVNCSAIPANLVESILFGREKGSFTGADAKHIGKFQEASGGTIFLDEVGELPLDIQAKLLRTLQDGEIDPVGSKRPVHVNVRVISATNRDLAQLVREERFREDLYYRLNIFPIYIPPLRERREDVPMLIDLFIKRFAASEGKKVAGLAPGVLDRLTSFSWPGNARQLENTIFRAVVLADGTSLTLGDFPQISHQLARESGAAPSMATAAGVAPTPYVIPALGVNGSLRPLQEIEDDMIRLALERHNGQMSEVARRLGIGRSTLYRKVRDLGLKVAEGS
ncbi:MAG: sigma-54-dependent Fis family transcriptional regulator [Alphaproteobacteria bacterium]|nr:sigma-54-dependent Fis family transcriptional regulator [Alphaproteobacteria bacterium]